MLIKKDNFRRFSVDYQKLNVAMKKRRVDWELLLQYTRLERWVLASTF